MKINLKLDILKNTDPYNKEKRLACKFLFRFKSDQCYKYKQHYNKYFANPSFTNLFA